MSDYVAVNREKWTSTNQDYTDAHAEEAWNQQEITWGVWATPESRLHALPPYAGKDVIELGCGTAYFSAWLKRGGARRVVGVDVTPAQLATANRLNQLKGLGLELIEANAESVPLPNAGFDIALSEYGASIWCDARKWIPEASRLLRVGGELVFLRNSTLSNLCFPDVGKVTETLQRPQRGMDRLEWPEEPPAVEFALPHGELIAVLRDSGFEITGLIEVYAGDEARDHSYYSDIPKEWGTRWPAEEIWKARKTDAPNLLATR